MMTYTQYPPHPRLAHLIDAYWTVTMDGADPRPEKILPDGCVDIIFNLGTDCRTDGGSFTLAAEGSYLVGTMTRFKMTTMEPGTRLLGVRFRPAGFSAFYRFDALHEIADRTIPFAPSLIPDLRPEADAPFDRLDRFFLDRLDPPRHALLQVVRDIRSHRGQVSVRDLARRHCTTPRQLEREFRRHVGMAPKKFINLARYQAALPLIRHNPGQRSLLDIALECGYYDHAHLSNEIRHFTGLAPSEL